MSEQFDVDLDQIQQEPNASTTHNTINYVNNLINSNSDYIRLMENDRRELLEIDELMENDRRELLEIDELMRSSDELLERLNRETLEIDELIRSSDELIDSIRNERLNTEEMIPTENHSTEVNYGFDSELDTESDYDSEFESDFDSDSDEPNARVQILRVNAKCNLYRGPIPLDSIKKYNKKECSICQENFECETISNIIISDCDHAFHPDCIDKWIEMKHFNGCPECRGPFETKCIIVDTVISSISSILAKRIVERVIKSVNVKMDEF